MKWRFGLFFGLVVGILIFLYTPPLRNKAAEVLSYNACNTPLFYTIDSIDSRFGLSRTDVEGDIQQATNIWSTAERKTLFAYSSNAALTVNFVYDQRQALNSQIQQLNTSLGQKNATLQQKVKDFETQEASYEQKLAAFQAEVNKYNNEGGAPPDIYKQLIQEQNDLNSEGQALNTTARQLNLSTSDYNANVSTLNQDIHQFNIDLSQKPEEGLYSGKDDTITIYLTNSSTELIHTLAHEFGHALGMEHVAGSTSIMYPYTSSSVIPTANDLQQLTYICRQQSLIVHDVLVFNDWLVTQTQMLQSRFL